MWTEEQITQLTNLVKRGASVAEICKATRQSTHEVKMKLISMNLRTIQQYNEKHIKRIKELFDKGDNCSAIALKLNLNPNYVADKIEVLKGKSLMKQQPVTMPYKVRLKTSYTPADDQLIADSVEKGLSFDEIAKLLPDRTRKAIEVRYYNLRKAGVYPDIELKRKTPIKPVTIPMETEKKKRVKTPWTKELDDTLVEAVRERLSTKDIAELSGKTVMSISKRIARLRKKGLIPPADGLSRRSPYVKGERRPRVIKQPDVLTEETLLDIPMEKMTEEAYKEYIKANPVSNFDKPFKDKKVVKDFIKSVAKQTDPLNKAIADIEEKLDSIDKKETEHNWGNPFLIANEAPQVKSPAPKLRRFIGGDILSDDVLYHDKSEEKSDEVTKGMDNETIEMFKEALKSGRKFFLFY